MAQSLLIPLDCVMSIHLSLFALIMYQSLRFDQAPCTLCFAFLSQFYCSFFLIDIALLFFEKVKKQNNKNRILYSINKNSAGCIKMIICCHAFKIINIKETKLTIYYFYKLRIFSPILF